MFDSKLRFVAVEIAYFSLWYEQLTADNQEYVYIFLKGLG